MRNGRFKDKNPFFDTGLELEWDIGILNFCNKDIRKFCCLTPFFLNGNLHQEVRRLKRQGFSPKPIDISSIF